MFTKEHICLSFMEWKLAFHMKFNQEELLITETVKNSVYRLLAILFPYRL